MNGYDEFNKPEENRTSQESMSSRPSGQQERYDAQQAGVRPQQGMTGSGQTYTGQQQASGQDGNTYSWLRERQTAQQHGSGANGPQGWNAQQHYSYYQRQPVSPQTRNRKKSGSGKKWGLVVAMALVFGLIAGSVTYGVNLVANRIYPSSVQNEAAADTTSAKPAEPKLAVTGSSSPSETPVSASGTKTVAQVAEEAMPALVTISTMSVQEMQSFFGTQQFEAEGAGTGVIVGENDTELLIATNNHVIEGAQEVSIGFIDESVIEAQIKGTDAANDLAVVAVKKEDVSEETMGAIKVAAIGDSDALVLGEQVVAIGNALGIGQSVTSGYISALDRDLDLSDGYNDFQSSGLIQTDAAINSGNSGGALLNMKGELVGINEAKSAYTSSGVTVDNVGYAIPMAKAQPILEDLMSLATREKYSEEEQGYLGVSLANVTSEFAQLYNAPEGVCFTEVAPDGPAAKAGAQKGDILTEFDGRSVLTADDMMRQMQYYASGDTVEMKVMRADNGEYKEHTLEVTLGTKDVLDALQQE